jgi:hypothetical protein
LAQIQVDFGGEDIIALYQSTRKGSMKILCMILPLVFLLCFASGSQKQGEEVEKNDKDEILINDYKRARICIFYKDGKGEEICLIS